MHRQTVPRACSTFKLHHTYELGLTVHLDCMHTETGATAVVTVAKIEEDIEAADYVVTVTCDATDKAKRLCADDFDGMDRMIRRVSMLKKAVEKKVVPQIKAAIQTFVDELSAK